MPERTISVNQAIDSGLQGRLAGLRLRDSPVGFRQVTQLKSFKKSRPPWLHGLGIFLPAPVILFNQLKVCATRNGRIHTQNNFGLLEGMGKLTVAMQPLT